MCRPGFSLGLIPNVNIMYSLLAVKISFQSHMRIHNLSFKYNKAIFYAGNTFTYNLFLFIPFFSYSHPGGRIFVIKNLNENCFVKYAAC